MTNHPDSTRLNKALSESGYCSRREADKLIEAGRVAVNGTKSTLGDRVFPDDVITVDGKPIKSVNKQIYLAFHKPDRKSTRLNSSHVRISYAVFCLKKKKKKKK